MPPFIKTITIKNIAIPCWILSCCLTFANVTYAQNDEKLTSGETYALIVGISNYEDELIKDLEFAHKDAMAFANYLTSKSGGSISNENIKLLVNEDATISNIYTAKREIEKKLKKDDLFYFYFSGHGDVEDGLYELGFLLCHDTPYKNYYSNAIRIEDINMMANTLSIKKNSKIIMITDACHSGKLVGSDNRGTALAGEQLAQAEKNEIRLASCEAEQLSQEGEAWGGGRGVFSYYLINGMMGQADAGDLDGVVTILELRSFLESKVSNDVITIKKAMQIPVIKGKSLAPVAIVNEEEFKLLKNNVDLTGAKLLASKSVGYEPTDSEVYFKNLSNQQLAHTLKFDEWKNKSKKDIINLSIEKFEVCETDKIRQSEWRIALKNDIETREAYAQDLASTLHNSVQLVINPFVSGREVHINTKDSIIFTGKLLHNCADMLHIAANLMDKENELYNITRVKEHYTRALALRFEIPFSDDPDKIEKEIEKEIEKANKIDNRAGFVKTAMSFKTTFTEGEWKKTESKTTVTKRKVKRTRQE